MGILLKIRGIYMAKESLGGNSSENAYLYLLFTFQFFAMVGLLINFISTRNISQGGNKMGKIVTIVFLGIWIWRVYDLTQQDVKDNITANFDPYRLLHINNDASFDTKAVKQAYRRLSVKYHPDKVD